MRIIIQAANISSILSATIRVIRGRSISNYGRWLRLFASRNSGIRSSFVIRISTFVILCAAAAHAVSAGRLRFRFAGSKSIRIGFGNHYKLGCWTPVEVELSGASGDSGARTARCEAPDGDAVPVWFIGPNIIWTDGRKLATAYAKIGRADIRFVRG